MLILAKLVLFVFCIGVFAWALDARQLLIALLAMGFALIFGAALLGLPT
jgi:hypothetical protein